MQVIKEKCARGKDGITPLFFLVSGEHLTLPFSELESIFRAEGYHYRNLERLIQVLRVEIDFNSVKAVVLRSSMTRICGIELFSSDADYGEIKNKIRNASFDGFIESGESFVVRIQRVRGSSPHIVGLDLEKKIGEMILKIVDGARVNLLKPQKTFFGVLTGNKFVFGLKIAEIPPKTFVERKPRNRPFFHPTAMSAKLARCLVNLAEPKTGDLLLDPFCGTSSILVEAGLIGCSVIGLDVQHRMIEGSLQNLSYYNIEPEGMIVADALHPPVSRVDCVVTDPPYGRSSTTLGRSPQEIVKKFLSIIENSIVKGKRICIAFPRSRTASKFFNGLGLKHVESHFFFVHRSLTREIAVFKSE